MLTADFFGNLRVLRNRARYNFSVIFSLNRPLEESIEPSMMTEFYDFVAGKIIYLPITDEPGTKFRMQYAQERAGKTVDKEILEQLIKLSGGFPREIKVCLEILLAQTITMSKEHLAMFLLDQRNVQRPLFELWQSLSPSEQNFLLSGTYQESDMDYPYLAHVGLLQNGKITIPLFEQFLRTQINQTPIIAQKEVFIFDINTNEIKKGSVILSDNLTSSEYRLLRFLLQNPDRVIEREELIQAVWKETATTAGVTDQAVDQLIFRVRRKIEEDPNNPQHIQTVKGRGVRFTP
jgi:DNA-binding winged helix-turn-helix (wHTH) protein